MLSERQKMVLIAIVEEYVKTAEPVGSKTLTERPDFALNYSSATIRNDMADLEEMGLIKKTHTSSGRIPSEEGYKLYVEFLLENKKEEESFPMIDEIFEQDLISREQAIKESMSLVTDITNYAAVVLGSSGYNAKIKKLQFVGLSDRYGVILMVTEKGYVESKKIIIPPEIKISEVEKVISLMNDILYDCPISEIDRVIKEKMKEEDIHLYIEYYDDLVSAFVRTFTNMAEDKYYVAGKSNIMYQPEFKDVSKAREIIEAIERQDILKAVRASDGSITVRIGKDNIIQAMHDCSIITVPYDLENGERGAIAVLGPTRMEYQKIIPLLEYIAKHIKDIK